MDMTTSARRSICLEIYASALLGTMHHMAEAKTQAVGAIGAVLLAGGGVTATIGVYEAQAHHSAMGWFTCCAACFITAILIPVIVFIFFPWVEYLGRKQVAASKVAPITPVQAPDVKNDPSPARVSSSDAMARNNNQRNLGRVSEDLPGQPSWTASTHWKSTLPAFIVKLGEMDLGLAYDIRTDSSGVHLAFPKNTPVDERDIQQVRAMLETLAAKQGIPIYVDSGPFGSDAYPPF